MRNNSNVAALVFIGAPVYIICRYGALAFGYDIKIENFYIRMRNNSNVAALVFIGAPVWHVLCWFVLRMNVCMIAVMVA